MRKKKNTSDVSWYTAQWGLRFLLQQAQFPDIPTAVFPMFSQWCILERNVI